MKKADELKLAELLKNFEPGFLPYPIFEQIARLVTLPILEFIPLRTKGDSVEVLLIKRSLEDPFWPGLLHTPGTVIRSTDFVSGAKKSWLAFERILKDELKDTKVSPAHYVGSIFHYSKRGAEQAQLYWVEVMDEPKVGSFYKIDSLPDGLINSQYDFIKEAVRNYKEYKSSREHPHTK